jgi:hypothetical protein
MTDTVPITSSRSPSSSKPGYSPLSLPKKPETSSPLRKIVVTTIRDLHDSDPCSLCGDSETDLVNSHAEIIQPHCCTSEDSSGEKKFKAFPVTDVRKLIKNALISGSEIRCPFCRKSWEDPAFLELLTRRDKVTIWICKNNYLNVWKSLLLLSSVALTALSLYCRMILPLNDLFYARITFAFSLLGISTAVWVIFQMLSLSTNLVLIAQGVSLLGSALTIYGFICEMFLL